MARNSAQRISVIDTHTGGEPTRVVMSGGPELGHGTMLERRQRFAERFDAWRRAIACEPRGSDVMVGALVTEPERADSIAGVIFFNNVGYLGMCGHGTIGVAVALAHAGRIAAGRYALDTPAGQVAFELLEDGRVRIDNVPSYRYRADVEIELPSRGPVRGDIAWGGNWFFLCDSHNLTIDVDRLPELLELTSAIRKQLQLGGITGAGGAEIDHVELVGRPKPGEQADARNFVLCPGGAYDRSPCGTGTSAKLACLAASGKLAPGQVWRQASVIGSVFEASYQPIAVSAHQPAIQSADGTAAALVRVSLTGSAHVNAEASLILDPRDPFCMGIER
ncbi:MAG: proline racemase family protein [Aureliella sp.]